MNWYLMPWQKFAQFTGRSRRKEYWSFVLGNFIIGFVLGLVGLETIGFVFALAAFIPGIAVAVRRLHDTDRSGWWLLIAFIPLIGVIILIVFLLLNGTSGANRFGPDPKEGAAVAA